MITLSPLEAREAGLPPAEARVVTVAEMAGLRGVAASTIYRWCREEPGRVPPTVRVGARIYFPVTTCVHWRPPMKPSLRGKWDRKAKAAAEALAQAAIAAVCVSSARSAGSSSHE